LSTNEAKPSEEKRRNISRRGGGRIFKSLSRKSWRNARKESSPKPFRGRRGEIFLEDLFFLGKGNGGKYLSGDGKNKQERRAEGEKNLSKKKRLPSKKKEKRGRES